MNRLTIFDFIIKNTFNDNCLYLYSPFGLGDTAVLMGLRQAIEERYRLPVVYVIRQSHEIVAQMYNITDYILVDDTRLSTNDERLHKLSQLVPTPTPGKLFIAHFVFHRINNLVNFSNQNNKFFGMLATYKVFLQLQVDCNFHYPNNINSFISNSRSNKAIDGKTALIIKEARTFDTSKSRFWDDLLNELLVNNYRVVTSHIDSRFNFPGIENVPCNNLFDLISLMGSSDKIFVTRSGICDITWQLGSKMTAVYENLHQFYWGRIKSIFPESNVNEILI